MPLFAWWRDHGVLAILRHLPVDGRQVSMLVDRTWVATSFDAQRVAQRCLDAFFGSSAHTEVYPGGHSGVRFVSEIIPVLSRKRYSVTRSCVAASVMIAFIARALGHITCSPWYERRRQTFFVITTMDIACPLASRYSIGSPTDVAAASSNFDRQMLFGIGFLFTVLIAGLTGRDAWPRLHDMAVEQLLLRGCAFHYVILGRQNSSSRSSGRSITVPQSRGQDAR